MVSFLDKLKVKVEQEAHQSEATETQEEVDKKRREEFLQLDVDIYQTATEVIIIAPIPGIDVQDLDIHIENENDVVTIQGRRDKPELMTEKEAEGGENKYLRQECQWGPFYRQIILPQEVNVSEVEANFKKGILILRLPMLRLQAKGKKKIEVDA
jgi:HSP20 family protein